MLRKLRFNDCVWTVALGTTLGIAGWSASNWFLGAFIDSSRLDRQTAGLIEAFELGAMALAMVLTAPFLPRLNFRWGMRVAGALIIVTMLASALLHNAVGLALARSFGGVGFGIVYALTLAAGGASADPDRTYAQGSAIQTVLGMAIPPSMGWAMDRYGQPGVFVGMAVYCGLLWLILLLIPVPSEVLELRTPKKRTEHDGYNVIHALAVVVAVALFGFATNGLFIFLERLGRAAGFSGPMLGLVMASSGPLGTAGAAAAALVGTRFGRALPLTVTLILTAVSNAILFITQTPVQFTIALWLWVAAYWAAYPYLFGLAASVDTRGRVTSFAGSTMIISGAFGSFGAGWVSQHWGFSSFAWISLGCCLISALLGLLMSFALETKRASGGDALVPLPGGLELVPPQESI